MMITKKCSRFMAPVSGACVTGLTHSSALWRCRAINVRFTFLRYCMLQWRTTVLSSGWPVTAWSRRAWVRSSGGWRRDAGVRPRLLSDTAAGRPVSLITPATRPTWESHVWWWATSRHRGRGRGMTSTAASGPVPSVNTATSASATDAAYFSPHRTRTDIIAF